MAVHVNISKISNDEKDVKINLMPCVIKKSGPANVSKYFESNVIKENDDLLLASFRGYPLMGREQNIPEGYRGYVLQETNNKMNETVDRNVYVTGEFEKLTYWNYDKLPSRNDGIPNALDWMNIAAAIHG